MAGRRRDYRKLAENAALLVAQVAGLAVPVGPALGLWRAARGHGPQVEDKAFVDPRVAQIESWRAEHAPLVASVGGMPSGLAGSHRQGDQRQ